MHFQFYTIRDDEAGRDFQKLLIRKAMEGVRVRVLYDGIGSYKLTKAYLQELIEAGVETACFLPPLIAFLDKRINYRNHRKIVVVDGTTGFLGGINIGNEYLGRNPRLGHWRDTHLRMRGPAVHGLQRLFCRTGVLPPGHESTHPPIIPYSRRGRGEAADRLQRAGRPLGSSAGGMLLRHFHR
ncbi:phospholipase D-like domain-containing protein [Paenibacillus sp. CC-CFT747]|nr:phospholipase D-like domain-containing protein [Paenibacillus sp. CC-CFT747]